MSYSAVTTIVKMLESLPDEAQERVAELVRDYIEDLNEETRWSENFKKSAPKLSAAAKQARREIIEGKAEPINFDNL